MKRIVVSENGWLANVRRKNPALRFPANYFKFLRRLLSSAYENGYDVSMDNQHWPK